LRFSADGRFLAYSATLSSTNQVYLYDFQTGNNLLVSRITTSATPASGASDSPDISADGRFIAFRSAAPDLVAGYINTNGVAGIFLYDRLSGTNVLLTTNPSNSATGNSWCFAPVFSSDGTTLVFPGWASDLVAGDFNQSGDLFAFMFLYATITAGVPGPTVTWPATPGSSYLVQFKTNLADADWQSLNGTITVFGNQASIQDPAPGAFQRFYRVIAH
jgi:Tol biopolymer transport system component